MCGVRCAVVWCYWYGLCGVVETRVRCVVVWCYWCGILEGGESSVRSV